MGAYLIEYETQLSSVVAEERFDQNIYGGRGRSSALLESEVAFYRLPGGAEWLGFRDVKRVNWKAGENERAFDRRGPHFGGR